MDTLIDVGTVYLLGMGIGDISIRTFPISGWVIGGVSALSCDHRPLTLSIPCVEEEAPVAGLCAAICPACDTRTWSLVAVEEDILL